MENNKKELQEQTRLQHEIVDEAKINIVTCGDCGTVILHRMEVEEIKCFNCGYVSEPADFPDLFFEHPDQPEEKLTKKAFKELCSFHVYGRGKNKRNAIYYDWIATDEGRGFKYMTKACVSQVNKTDLFNMFYEWIINDGNTPDYSHNRKAETDKQRFKVSLSG